MEKEQEEAIERLKYLIIDLKSSKKVNEIVTKEGKFNLVKDLETVLSMLKENSAEIEQKNTELAEKSAEIEKYKSLYNKALEDLVKADRENIENKKVIDLMAETIRKLAISLASYEGSYNKETINFTGNIKDIKQYFEQKATKNS